MVVHTRPAAVQDRHWLTESWTGAGWGLPIVTPSGCYDPSSLPAIVAVDGSVLTGAVAYHQSPGEVEVVALIAVIQRMRIGSTLLTAVRELAHQNGARLWLITTDDNELAKSFYEHNGMHVARVHRRFVDVVREHKPMTAFTFTDAIEFSY